MNFRNLTLFRFSPDVAGDLVRLAPALGARTLRSCGPLEMFTRGFVPPAGGEALTLDAGACTLVAAGGWDKILPASVINDELRARIRKISDDEGRSVRGRERKRIREDVLTALLPRAFVKASRVNAYVDKANGWLVLDTASRNAAEGALTMLRVALDRFPAVPLAPEEDPRALMTDWLTYPRKLPDGLVFGEEVELRDPASASGAIAKCRRQDLQGEEVLEHLRNGKQVFQLGLVFDDRISFVLGEDLVIRKLMFSDVVFDQLESAEDAESEAVASFTLLTLELERLLAKLAEWFGLARPRSDPGVSYGAFGAVGNLVENMKKSVGPGGSVTIESAAGNVTINGGGGGKPH